MARVIGIFLVLMVALVGTTGPALADAQVALEPADDGTLRLVGSGWRPGQQLVVSIGTLAFPAVADSTGEFEVPTSLSSSGGPAGELSVRRQDTLLGFARLDTAPLTDSPHPLAVLFAQSVLTSASWVVATAAILGLCLVSTRRLMDRRGREARP